MSTVLGQVPFGCWIWEGVGRSPRKKVGATGMERRHLAWGVVVEMLGTTALYPLL